MAKKKVAKKKAAPMKVCPSCGKSCHARCSKCPHCGAEFKKKVAPVKKTAAPKPQAKAVGVAVHLDNAIAELEAEKQKIDQQITDLQKVREDCT